MGRRVAAFGAEVGGGAQVEGAVGAEAAALSEAAADGREQRGKKWEDADDEDGPEGDGEELVGVAEISLGFEEGSVVAHDAGEGDGIAAGGVGEVPAGVEGVVEGVGGGGESEGALEGGEGHGGEAVGEV